MSTFLNRFSNSAAQRIETDTAGAIYHDGLLYAALDKLVISYGGTPAVAIAGIGQSATGELLCVDAAAGLPADTFWQSGLPISAAQQRLCVDAAGATTYVHQGVPFTAVGAVAIA